MTIEQFVEKAIEGGYEGKEIKQVFYYDAHDENEKIWMAEQCPGKQGRFSLDELLLDPLAWQAVGKVERWKTTATKYPWCDREEWQNCMHRMIDALCEGRTLEDYIRTL